MGCYVLFCPLTDSLLCDNVADMTNHHTKAPKPVREWLSEIGKRGGANRSPKKMAAVKANLDKAREKRWPGRGQPFVPELEPQEDSLEQPTELEYVPSTTTPEFTPPGLHMRIVDIMPPKGY